MARGMRYDLAAQRSWLTVAEAQRLRREWDAAKAAVDKLADRYDADPDDEQEAMAFVAVATLAISGFLGSAVASAERVRDLRADRQGA